MSLIRDNRFFLLLIVAALLTLLIATGANRANSAEETRVYLPAIFYPEVCDDIFEDDFSDPDTGWLTGDAGDALFEYRDGEYRIVANTPNLLFRPVAPVTSLQDYALEAEMRWANGIYNGIYGILFGGIVDEEDERFLREYYIMIIYADREEYRIRHFTKIGENSDGSPILEGEDVVPRTKENAINDSFQQNTLRVVFVGDSIDAYVNDVKVVEGVEQVGSDLPTITGLVSVANPASPGNDARYDDYVLDGCNLGTRGPAPQFAGSTPQAANLSVGDLIDSAELWD